VPIEVGIWRIDGEQVARVTSSKLDQEERLEAILEQDFGITHTTLQVDHVPEGRLVEFTPRRNDELSSA